MTDLTPIIDAVAKLCLVLITTFLIPWVKKRIDGEKLLEIRKWTMIAVEAAEMIYNDMDMGETKRLSSKSSLPVRASSSMLTSLTSSSRRLSSR